MGGVQVKKKRHIYNIAFYGWIIRLFIHIYFLQTCSFQDPLATDLVLSLSLDGIRLLFDSVTQRLRVIEIFNMSLLKLKYW